MEIERKFLVRELPADLSAYQCLVIEQAYLCTAPVVRIRRQDDEYYLTYKGSGLMAREEYNLPLNEAAYKRLLTKADGNIISKKRYLIPLFEPAFAGDHTFNKGTDAEGLKVELDIFGPPFAPLMIAEVEFPDVEMANAFIPPKWLGEDVTGNMEYHNSNLSKKVF